jgi:hypothetical protein
MAGSVKINRWTIFACEPQVSDLVKDRVNGLEKKWTALTGRRDQYRKQDTTRCEKTRKLPRHMEKCGGLMKDITWSERCFAVFFITYYYRLGLSIFKPPWSRAVPYVPNHVRDDKYCLKYTDTNVRDVSLFQWYSTWGTRRHLRGYVKLKRTHILFNDKHIN